jgi:hypothetical protein
MAEPLSAERLAYIRERDAGWHARLAVPGVYGQRRELLAEVDRLRAALDFAERAAADRLGEDERWLAGWKAAREQAARALFLARKHLQNCSCRDCLTLADAAAKIREMQP